MRHKENWEETKARFVAWWSGKPTDRPLMRIIAKRKEPLEPLEPVIPPQDPESYHLDVERKVSEMRNFCRTHLFLAEAFPSLDVDLGPGSMATYLGAEPVFTWDTVWYTPCFLGDLTQYVDLVYREESFWLQRHLGLVKAARMLAHDDFLINIPDIMESVDVLASLRGAQELVYDFIDHPETVRVLIERLDQFYPCYYQAFYDLVTQEEGSSYTVFAIWGPGRVAKIQCDFSALMSPRQFREFALPSLARQCRFLDYTLYHLDGVDAIKHLDALMEIKELDALQWTPGFGKPDGGSEEWYPIYDKVRAAGKALWINIEEGTLDEWFVKAKKLVERYGPQGLYLLFPIMSQEEATVLYKEMSDCS